MKRMSYRGQFVRAFGQLLATYPTVPSRAVDCFRALAREPRVEAAASHRALSRWVAATGDAALGVRAGQLVRFGEGGVLDFAMHSARSIREASEVANWHAAQYGDALNISIEVPGERALLRFDNRLAWPAVVADFMLSAWYSVHLSRQLTAAAELECWFAHEAPPELEAYQQAFPLAQLKFGMPYYAFSFAARWVDEPLASADAALHTLHRSYLASVVERAAAQHALAPRVRELIAAQMRRGRPTAVHVTRRLKMSRRTLSRRLIQEGTSFKTLLDELRCKLALRFVADGQLPLEDISNQLSFSRVQGFHRAFRRWAGTTPGNYRRMQAGAGAAERPSADLDIAVSP
jgi:AraC-like DNA-binding protein